MEQVLFIIGEDNEQWLIAHKEAVTVDELICIGKVMGVIE